MIKLFNYLFPKAKSDLNYVKDLIFKKGVTNVIDTNPIKDQRFNVGIFLLEFGDRDTICQLKLPNDIVPMFIFEGDEVKEIRQTVIGVYSKAVS